MTGRTRESNKRCQVSEDRGQTGPLANRPGYDFIIQAMSGLMSITGTEKPTKVGVAVSDLITGLYATVGILGAYTRAR